MGKDRKGKDSEVNREDGDASEGEREKGTKKERRRERGIDKSRERARDKSKERGRNRSRERVRDRSRERDQEQTREKEKEHPRSGDRGRRRKRSRERDGRRDEKEHPYESRHRSSRKELPQSRGRSSSASEDESSQAKRKKVKPEEPEADEGEKTKSSGEVSLSIEETNKLRASLGLKPLHTDDQEDSSKNASSATEEVHAPPVNIGSVQAAQKLKDKMETMKEKRRQHKQLSAIKTLGEADEEESTSQWVQKMRMLHEEKEKAEKRAKLLNEMDEEFGVGELVEDTIRQRKQQSYSSKDLKGLKVEHKIEEFPEERSVVLTLKDAGVLEETADVLVNVNIIEAEKAAQNVELRKKKTGYNPYEEEEVEFEKSSILKKYDEEIEGVTKPVFELGDSGYVDTSEQREADIVKQRLQAQALTLQQAPAQIASEYYTKDEVAQFRKPKKKKKIRRLKADDLLSLSAEGSHEVHEHRDHGSRQVSKSDVSSTQGTLVDEEMDPIIGSALQRTHRLLVQGRPQVSGAAKIAEMIHSVHETKEETQIHGSEDAIVLDKTAEFCRQLGEEDESTAIHQKSADLEGMEFQESTIQEVLGGWTEVEPNAPKSSQPKEEELYQEAEPVVATGVSAALQMAVKKGFVDTEKKKKDPSKIVHVYSDEQRDREYERQKERERERDLSHSRSGNFPEKKDYNPLISIEYVDDKGRALTPKEAFRYMSHKFHGRGSGKKKTEKRMKKLQEEHFMNRSSSVDTPLNTLSMLQVKQKKSQTPYILLSGGSQSMLAPDLEKK